MNLANKLTLLRVVLVPVFMAFLLIDNTSSGIVRQDRNGRYLTTKKHGKGLGLSSVRSIVERYEGSLRISHEDHMFCVSIMLNLPMEE